MANINMKELMDLVNAKRTQIKARSGGFTNTVKPPAGRSRWRILPSWRGEDNAVFFHDFAQHFAKDREGNVKAVFLCEENTFGHECPYCAKVGEAIRSTKDDGALKILKEMKSKPTYVMNAVRLDGESADAKKPVLLQLPSMAMDLFLNLLQERQDDGILILDPKEGRDIIISREGSGQLTKYKITDGAKNTAVDPEALTALINIDEFLAQERAKSQAKRIEILESATSSVAGMISGTAGFVSPSLSRGLVPAAAAKVTAASEKPGRVIDVEVEQVEATKPAPAPSSPDLETDEELAKLLDDLDK